MNISLVRDGFERSEAKYTIAELIVGTMTAERPLLAAPHQILATFADDVFDYPPNSPRSLIYHAWVTFSATFVGFIMGSIFGIALAVLIVQLRTLQKSLLPWIICSQMVPILALAPIFIVVLGAIGIHGLFPKALISAYLCFFPVTIGMVKGLNTPDPMQLDLMLSLIHILPCARVGNSISTSISSVCRAVVSGAMKKSRASIQRSPFTD